VCCSRRRNWPRVYRRQGGSKGARYATNGCILTTDEVTSLIEQLIENGDPLTTLTVTSYICVRWIIICIVVFLSCSGLHAQKQCTETDAKNAETEASSLKTWSDVYSSYKRYAQCDDGAIGEGYSSTVARLLADDWSQFGKLKLLMSDKSFAKFVLLHIDQLMSKEQEKAIRQNASKRCPAGAKVACKSILNRLKQTAP
jgi:hypothetical protein